MVRVVPSTQKNVEGLVSLNIKHGLRTASAFLYLSPQSAVRSPQSAVRSPQSIFYTDRTEY